MPPGLPIWFLVYLVAFVLLLGAGVLDDLNERKPHWYTCGGLISGLASVVLMLAFWDPPLAESVRWMAIPMLGFAFSWDAFDVRQTLLSRANHDGELSLRERLLVAACALVVFAPAYVLGLLVCLNLFR